MSEGREEVMFAWIYICVQKVDISIRYLLFGTDRTSGPDFFPQQMVYNARCVSVCDGGEHNIGALVARSPLITPRLLGKAPTQPCCCRGLPRKHRGWVEPGIDCANNTAKILANISLL